MSHKDEATREVLASELGELKDKHSQLQQAYNDLLNRTAQEQAQGLEQQGQQAPQGQLKDTFYEEANLEAAGELGHS